jgi:OOP family OmpA-OmpF porin
LEAGAQTPAPALRMDSGFYLGAGIGRSEARDFCRIQGGACDDKDQTWNLFVGYQINRHFAVELGYSDFGDATTSGFVGGVGSRATLSAKAAELVGVGLLPLGDHFALYGKLGFFRYDADGTGTGGFPASASDKGTEFTFGLGAQYDFNGRFAVRAEWQRYLQVGSGFAGLPNADIALVRATGRYKF